MLPHERALRRLILRLLSPVLPARGEAETKQRGKTRYLYLASAFAGLLSGVGYFLGYFAGEGHAVINRSQEANQHWRIEVDRVCKLNDN